MGGEKRADVELLPLMTSVRQQSRVKRRRTGLAAEAWERVAEGEALLSEDVCLRDTDGGGLELHTPLFTAKKLRIPGFGTAVPEWVNSPAAVHAPPAPQSQDPHRVRTAEVEAAAELWRLVANRPRPIGPFQRVRVLASGDAAEFSCGTRLQAEWNARLALRHAVSQLAFSPAQLGFEWRCVNTAEPSGDRHINVYLEAEGDVFTTPELQDRAGHINGPVVVLDVAAEAILVRGRSRVEDWMPQKAPPDASGLVSPTLRQVVADDEDLEIRLKACGSDQAPQPPRFRKHKLRSDQLRSLRFMLDREANPAPFQISICQRWAAGVIAEHQPESREWSLTDGFRKEDCWGKVEARTGFPWSYETQLRATFATAGGVLGDPIGSGKTATLIGLLDSQRSSSSTTLLVPSEDAGRFVPARGTLILLPSNLLAQWQGEFTRFLGPDSFKFVVIQSFADLCKITAGELADADVVLVSYKILYSPHYLERLRSLQCTRTNRLHERSFFGKPIDKTLEAVERGMELFLSKDGWKKAGWTMRARTAKERDERAPEDLLTDVEVKGRLKLLGVCSDWRKLKQPVLQLFYWHRIVFDEFHELEAMDRRRCTMLQHLRAHCRWGLTGTPPMRDVVQIYDLAKILRVQFANSDAAECQQFLEIFVRQNKAELPEIPVQEHRVVVQQTPEERALYMQQVHEGSRRSLLQFCSHHCLQQVGENGVEADNADGADSSAFDGSARATVARLGEHKQQVLAKLHKASIAEHIVLKALSQGATPGGTSKSESAAESKLAEAEAAVDAAGFAALRKLPEGEAAEAATPAELAKAALAHIDQSRPGSDGCCKALRALIDADPLVSKAQLRSARITQLGRCVTALEKLLVAARSERFFQATLAAVKAADADNHQQSECPVCLEPVDSENAAVLPCSHVFHSDCVRRAAAAAQLTLSPKCPTCRAPFKFRDIVALGCAAPDTGGCDAGEVERFGSKLAAVGKTLRDIAAKDPSAKAIVFVQWRELEALVGLALHRMGVPHIRLRGPASHRGRLLSSFQMEDEPKVLLQSLENSASGANLTRASHVLLVHPMDADSPERAVAYEMQALGRVRRCGQTADRVHLWRFITRGTVEEELSEEHQQGLSSGFASVAAPGRWSDASLVQLSLPAAARQADSQAAR